MKKIISQETFNETVRENITELEMAPQEALEETIEQYEAQGVDLSNIIKTLDMVQGVDPVKQIVDKLKTTRISADHGKLAEDLSDIRRLCGSDLAYKMLAGKHGVYDELLFVLKSSDEQTTLSCLETLVVLMDGYPDLLDDAGMGYIIATLEKEQSMNVIKLVLQWVCICCIRHETNRQNFFAQNIAVLLKRFIRDDVELPVVKAACAVIYSLTLDDDIRVLVPNTHNHACTLASEFLEPLVKMLKVVKEESTLSEVVNALCSVMVRNEFCGVVSSNGGVETIMQLLHKHKSLLLIRRLLKLLTNLAGNDDVRDEIMKAGAAEHLAESMNKHVSDVGFANKALLLVSKLSLRVAKHGGAFIKAGCLELIVQAMSVHSGNIAVQRSGCWALRNIATHNKAQKELFIKLGVEEMINQIIKDHNELAQDATAVLISLDCTAKLTERWTGESGDRLVH